MNIYGFDVLQIALHIIIAIAIAVPLGKVHELCHLRTAKRLGYKVTNFQLWKNEIEIDIKHADPNTKKIAYAPYYIMIPICLFLIGIGWQYQILGVFIAGVGSLLIHMITLPLEGRDLKEQEEDE